MEGLGSFQQTNTDTLRDAWSSSQTQSMVFIQRWWLVVTVVMEWFLNPPLYKVGPVENMAVQTRRLVLVSTERQTV